TNRPSSSRCGDSGFHRIRCQRTTEVHPGQTFDLDYSVTQNVPLDKDQHTLLQIGVVGYETTDRTTPIVNPLIAPRLVTAGMPLVRGRPCFCRIGKSRWASSTSSSSRTPRGFRDTRCRSLQRSRFNREI